MADIVRIIRKRLVYKLRNVKRSPVLGKRGEGYGGEVSEGDPEPVITVGFVYVPCSDDSLYSWGKPYEPGNQPLGTPLTSAAQSDCSFNQYRLSIAGEAIRHNQTQMGGRHWKRNEGTTLSWDPLWGYAGQESLPDGMLSHPIYYKGEVIASYSRQILAASTDGQYIYIVAMQGDIMYLARQLIEDWETPPYDQTGTWTESPGFFVPGNWREGSNISTRGTCDINKSCNQAVVVCPQLVTGSVYNGEIQYIMFTVDWDAGMNQTVTVVNDSENNFSHTEKERTPNTIVPAPCASTNDCGTHCFLREFDSQISQNTFHNDARYTADGSFVIKAYYKEGTDDIVTTTVDIHMEEDESGGQDHYYTWTKYEDEESGWGGTGYIHAADIRDSDTTLVTITEGELDPIEVELYNREYTYDATWSKSWELEYDSCYETGNDTASGSAATKDTQVKREIRMPALPRKYPVDGMYVSTVEAYSKDLRSQASDAYCKFNTGGGGNTCIAAYHTYDTIKDEEIKTQEMQDRVIDAQGTLYNETYTDLPEGKGSSVEVDPIYYCYPRYYDEATFSYKNSMRHIMNRSFGLIYAGLTIASDSDHFEITFMPGITVGQMYVPISGTNNNEFKVIWTGGDLMAATGVTGNRQRLHYWEGVGIGIVG